MVKLPTIPLDKQAHALGGYALAVTFGVINPWVGLMVAVVAAAGKEWYDSKHPERHDAELMDFVATCTGGVLGTLFSLTVF